jgi:hypothetical protein
MDKSGDSFTVSRRFTVTSSVLGMPPRHGVSEPSIVIRGGHAFGVDGSPILYDPSCKFYSASTFGDPPRYIRTGVSWDFHQPSNFRGHTWVHVTVATFDEKSLQLRLHITTKDPSTYTLRSRIDMTIEDGGIITSETASSDFATVSAFPGDVGTPSIVTVFKLVRD